MATLNPYQPPSAPLDQSGTTGACPKCGNQVATKVGFTWWGGALGPRLFHVVRCTQCRTQYNGKTGASLTKVIILYQVVVLAICAAVGVAYYLR